MRDRPWVGVGGGGCLDLSKGEGRGLRQSSLGVPARSCSLAPFTMELRGVGMDHCSHRELAVGLWDSAGTRAWMAR